MSKQVEYTALDRIEDHVSSLRQVFLSGKLRDLKKRKQQLHQLYRLVEENQEAIHEALAQDLRKPKHEAFSGEIAPVLDECLYFIEHLDRLAKDEKVKPRLTINRLAQVMIRREPLGLVLILGCWNYPLALVPLAGAIAAGNTVILKPSEIAPYTATLISRLFSLYMDTNCYRIVNGGPEETTELLKYPFDHIFYTGNQQVAKIIMTAAAQHLTPVTLELGGKCPAIILSDADIQLTANRIAWGKLFNAGQVCIAVDYVVCPTSKRDAFVAAYKRVLEEWYTDPQTSKDYARIVSERHVKRIADMLNQRQSGEIVVGGTIDLEDRYVAPTLVTGVDFDDPSLMSDEIFGPVLPLITYQALDEAIAMVNRHPSPLALYLFSNQKSSIEQVLNNTRSGGVTINDCLVHQAEYAIPFGGVGASGMGSYHGDKSFSTFTHERSMIIKKQTMEGSNQARYPPYSESKYALLRLVLGHHPLMLTLKKYKSPLKIIVAICAFLVFYFKRKNM
ncbi:Aldehyde dehydrogenase, dimeric NADP-preferring [Choanephora cucurbitarum]|uniref:Aldehyde dehydrogenase n=1 Tax=Choanephora cucurbitarum TaxID=101091 RepID=A0A1C7NCJ8_9FUNG|nr:Aldehyde dehydrogenase, dimeric NADP-preferring [Choanephora cucurbitarum]